MNKYIIIENNKVKNIISAPEAPSGKTAILIDETISITPSQNSYYDSSTNTFYPPVSYEISNDNNSYHTDVLLDGEFMSGSYSLGITCSLTRGMNPISSTNLSSQDEIIISNFNHDTSNNIITFTVETGSDYLPNQGLTQAQIKFDKQLPDTMNQKWDLKPIDLVLDC